MTNGNGLPRRFAPRNDGGEKTDSSAALGMTGNGLPRRKAPRNDGGGTDSSAPLGMTRDSHGLRPRNDDGGDTSSVRLRRTPSPQGEGSDTWEIRKGGKVWVSSTAENCGYKEPALESLRKAGYSLYKNGVCVMKGARR